MSNPRNYKKSFIVAGSITAGLTGIAAAGLYLIRKKPIRLLLSSYKVNNTKNIDITSLYQKKNNGPGNLIIYSHDYNRADPLIAINEIKDNNKNKDYNAIISSRHSTKKLNNIFGNTRQNHNLEQLFIEKNSNLTEKCSDIIKNGSTVTIFLSYLNEKKGIYHIIKNSNCNVFLVRINCENPKLRTRLLEERHKINHINTYIKTINSVYQVDYDIFDNPTENESPEEYMTRLKKHLYLDNIYDNY